MSGRDNIKFTDRLSTAADARRAMLDKFRSRPAADDPEVIARNERRQALADAREARHAEQEAARAVQEAARREMRALEGAQAEARARAEDEQRNREATERAKRDAALVVEQKAARDARYAARKAHK